MNYIAYTYSPTPNMINWFNKLYFSQESGSCHLYYTLADPKSYNGTFNLTLDVYFSKFEAY